MKINKLITITGHPDSDKTSIATELGKKLGRKIVNTDEELPLYFYDLFNKTFNGEKSKEYILEGSEAGLLFPNSIMFYVHFLPKVLKHSSLESKYGYVMNSSDAVKLGYNIIFIDNLGIGDALEYVIHHLCKISHQI